MNAARSSDVTDTVYQQFGVDPVINAAGKMTALGGTAQSDAVANAQAAAAQSHVDLATLRRRAGELVAHCTGAQAASITSGAAAGIAISVAACITGTHLDRVLRVPNTDGLRRRVLLQAGHDINFGASVTQMIELGGGRAEIIGWANSVPKALLDAALSTQPDVVALLFVQSHHSVQEQMVPLVDCVAAAHRNQVPVIVDAAAEEDLERYIELGADLVTYSGGKAIGGPTVGFIAGRHDLIEACELQQRGIARAMKVGKEQIVGLLVALEHYANRDLAADRVRQSDLVGSMMTRLNGVAGLRVYGKPDEAGRGILRLALERSDGGDIGELVKYLVAGSPSIRTRNHHVDDGVVLVDPREIDELQAVVVADRIRRFFESARTPCNS
jgi:L-seryl-tRNA(Ser) seleniumtransferase/D-glucosaminate-6-phosphate ammonia-lyase